MMSCSKPRHGIHVYDELGLDRFAGLEVAYPETC
jgi:hypothetical protein